MQDHPVPHASPGVTPLPLHPLVQRVDFERVLSTPTRARSPHFALHHLVAAPVPSWPRTAKQVVPELSTVDAPSTAGSVDNLSSIETAPPALWLGTVVPRRHARRSVTRSLIKRQMRAAVRRHAAALSRGLWVVRLRGSFDRQQFPSAASDALRCAVHDELEAMLQRVLHGMRVVAPA